MSPRLSVPAFVLLLTGLLSAALPRAQSAATGVVIAGSVVDATLTPLAGATVTLERSGRAAGKAVTDSAGNFLLVGIAPGDYRVRAEHAGFPVYSRELHVPIGSTRLQLPIVLARPQDAMPKAEDVGHQDSASARIGRPMPSPLPAAAPVAAQPQAAAGAIGARAGHAAGPLPFSPGTTTEVPILSSAYDAGPDWRPYEASYPNESYAHVAPNRFNSTVDRPLSTFGADVDTASYTNVRRFLSSGQLPPRDAVRVEDFLNYFRFDYPEPRGNDPMALTTEIGECPWAPAHRLVLIGAKAKAASPREAAGRNIVLLIDVSGSMAPPDRLPLIKSALAMFVDSLRPDDRIAIVTYAGTSGVALPSTSAREKSAIQNAIARLGAGGSTNGGQGLILAYRLAREAFIPGGINRVILATDGDFNVGIVNLNDLLHLIVRERDSGIFLSVFGVGRDNLKDSTMEMLADKGNGQYAYLDTLQEARRVLVREGDATLETVAKDVKFQVEFNPAVVGAWKLIGYEDRRMPATSFNDDRKDGGEVGAGHTVTVLYEIIPAGAAPTDNGGRRPGVDPLRYQPAPSPAAAPSAPADAARRAGAGSSSSNHADEWLTVKVRYKAPDGDVSRLMTQPVRAGGTARYLPFASALAEFGLLLRDGTADPQRWDGLARRFDRLQVPPSLAADRSAAAELVAVAGGLARRR